MSNPMESADIGDILVRDGVEWEVIGICFYPTYNLQRVGLRHLTTNEHTRQSVVPHSPWAAEWKSQS